MFGKKDKSIGLIDVDSHNFPNLALMKLSAWHKLQGDNVEFVDMFNHYDIIYKSKVFSWTPDDITAYDCDKYIEGGTGYDYSTILPQEINNICPDYNLYNCQHAYGFLTRGCIRNCSWCIVPEKEGKIRPENDIQDFIADKKSAILMDNNVLASEYGIEQIEKIIKIGIKVDFNQGLDARLIDNNIAKLLSQVNWIRFIRLACDTIQDINNVLKAINLIRNYKSNQQIFIYLLVKDIESAAERANIFRDMKNISPFAQAYRDYKNTLISKAQKDFCRWVNVKSIFKTVKWENYTG